MPGRPLLVGRFPAVARWRGWRTVAAFLLAAFPAHEVALSLGHSRPPGTPIDAEVAPLVAALPPSGRVGWAGDPPLAHDTLAARVRLQFAAAPRVVVGTAEGVPAVVLWASDEERLARLLREHRLRVVARFAAGYVLCEHEGS